MRNEANGKIAATAMIANAISPAARPSGGSQSHSPSQDTVRKRPMTVASVARAGHSRSQKIVQRARRNAVPSSDRVTETVLRCPVAGLIEGSVTKVSAEECSA